MILYLVYKFLGNLLASKRKPSSTSVHCEVSIVDTSRSINLVSEFKNGGNKNTRFEITRESLLCFMENVSNFLKKNQASVKSPVLSYKIIYNDVGHVSTFDLLEALPTDEGTFMDHFLNLSYCQTLSRKFVNGKTMNPRMVLNDLDSKNYRISQICILNEKNSSYENNLNLLNCFEKIQMIRNSLANQPRDGESDKDPVVDNRKNTRSLRRTNPDRFFSKDKSNGYPNVYNTVKIDTLSHRPPNKSSNRLRSVNLSRDFTAQGGDRSIENRQADVDPATIIKNLTATSKLMNREIVRYQQQVGNQEKELKMSKDRIESLENENASLSKLVEFMKEQMNSQIKKSESVFVESRNDSALTVHLIESNNQDQGSGD